MSRSYSPSALSTLRDCEYSYWLRYIEKVPETSESSKEQKVGSAVHYALEQAARERIIGRIPRGLPAEPYELTKHLNTIPWEVSRKFGSDAVAAAKSALADIPSERMLWVKRAEFPWRIDLSNGLTIKGIFDRIDEFPSGLVRIVDYKTGFPMAGVNPDSSPQTLIYGLAAWKMFPYADRIEVRYFFIGANKKHDVHITPTVVEHAEALLRESDEELQRLEASGEPFPARVTTRCAACKYRHACAAYKAEVGETRAESTLGYEGGEVLKMVDEYARINARLSILEGRKKEISAALLPAFSASNPIIITENGAKAKLVSRQSREFRDNAEAVALTSKLTGISEQQVANEILSASRAKADKLLGALDDADRKHALEVLDDATLMGCNTFIEIRKGKPKKMDD